MKLLFRISITLMFTALLFRSMPVQSTKATTNTLLNNWSSLGPIPVNGQVNAIAISGTGDVYVDSDFMNGLGWSRSDTIAKWDGTSWSFLGTTPLNGSVTSIAISDEDEVYVGGLFSNAGSNSNADHIAKWNGTSWSALGTIPLTDNVYAIAVNGNVVYAGGTFHNAGGDPNADYIAKWDGTSWSALGTPLSVGVSTIAVNKTTGDIYAGGNFTNAGGDPNADYLAKWNGTSWSALGTTPLNSNVSVIAISETGDVYAGGNFTNAGGNANADYIAKWNGTNWSSLGITPSTPKLYDLYGRAIAVRGNEVYVGFASGGGYESAMFVAKWDGAVWSDPAASQLTYSVYSLAINDTFLYVGGSFKDAGGNSNADYIAMVELPALSSLYVTNTNDNGPGSLRKAISDASNGDTITFDSSLAGQKIRLQSTLTIDKNITIDASALSEKIILSGDSDNDGDGDVVVLNVGVNKTVVLKNLTFTNGYSSSSTSAGAIENLGNLEIYDSQFISNTGGQGGAIRNSQYLLIENSSFTSNTAIEGGGIFNELNQTLTITRSTFSNNSAVARPGPVGGAAGAIANIGTANIGNSSFLNNQSQTGGGAIVNSLSGNAAISNSAFTGNTTFGNGGAINNLEGTMTIGGSTFTNNAAINYSGGAISNSAQLTINESSFSANQANLEGGGAVANSLTGAMLISDSSISANTSTYGAGIFNEGSAEITNTEISTNSATQGGGGILNGLDGNGTLSFSNGTISGNSASYGGGVFNLSNNGSVTLANCSINGNTSTNPGSGHGGGASNFVQMTINNCTITNNSAPHYGGGVFSTGTLTVNNSTMSDNSALTSGGIEFYGTLSLKNTIIANSTTGKDCFSSNGTMTQNINNLIEDNAASPNQCGTPSLTSDPNLGTLANNGGPTQTMALLNGSPAINAGHDASCIDTDQRGIVRPQGIHCDIGAYEYQNATSTTTSSITRASTSPTSAASVNFTVTFSESVTGVGVNDFNLTTTGVTSSTVTGITPVSASVYTVSVNTGYGSGSIRLDVPTTAIISDLAGNSLNGLPFSTGESYAITKQSPDLIITNVVLDPSNPTINETFNVIITINNQGGSTGPATIYRDVYIGVDPLTLINPMTGCPSPGSYFRFDTLANLGPGQSDTKSVSITGGLPKGNYQLWVYVDSRCLVHEAGEVNNGQ